MDNSSAIWRKFFEQRTTPLWNRFPGYYRAEVVETNDPLVMYRVRFKCPDLHDFDLRPEQCPWAVSAFDLGSKRHGRWAHPCIGDWVWITFERNHPYGPIWVGFATPTRRRFYAYPSIFNVTPVSVNENGVLEDRPKDFDENFLPKDLRPMSHGWVDRYGNLDLHSAVGFFPKEHKRSPAPVGGDAIQRAALAGGVGPIQQEFALGVKPEVNSPDVKLMARVTKYGHIFLLGDQGYWWSKEGDGADSFGEFVGDHKQDEDFEIARWNYLRSLLNEGQSSEHDQRHILLWTRYGHKFEMRDTGWAQLGDPERGTFESLSRQGEYGDPTHLSKQSKHDFRWIKLRTKGGMLFQMSDKGFHPADDEFVRRSLKDEIGAATEDEDVHWAKKDARWIRWMTRYGFKIVLDDRGSDSKGADKSDFPRGNGVLIKGRRTPGSAKDAGNPEIKGKERGFYWEFNEDDEANHSTWGSPLGQAIELNDNNEYMMLAVGLGDFSEPWRGLEENEFLLKPTRLEDVEKLKPDQKCYHLVLDHQNEFLRLKTRGGNGEPPHDATKNPSGLSKGDEPQGLEARDGELGDGPWVELVDGEKRGLWFSKNNNLGIWRAKKGTNILIWMDDGVNKKELILHNQEGRIQLFSNQNIEIISDANIVFKATDINFKATNKIKFEAGRTPFTIEANQIRTRATISVADGDNIDDPIKAGPPKIEPTDRAKTYNESKEIPRKAIEHPIEPLI